jgi:two-component system chemotaxis response regulator CheB
MFEMTRGAAHSRSATDAADEVGAIRLMIVDDSVVARAVITRILETRPGFKIAAVAGSADRAIELLATVQVDIILLDVEMPGTDGLTALPRILEVSDGARVLIVSSACGEGAAATVKALTLGAADTLLKPGAGNLAGRFADELYDRLLRLGHARRAVAAPVGGNRVLAPASGADPVACLAIGASTGGIHSLSAFFRALPETFRAPILITQHLPAAFMPYFAAQLQEIAGRKTITASDGARLRAGEMLIAPGDAHINLIRMRDGGVRVRLDRTPSVSGCLPSVDPMFEAVAKVFGAGALGVVLSGMGRDGVGGAAALVAAGGEVLAQDAATSVVWGMPGAVANAGLATAILPPDRIAARIGGRMTSPQWK